MQLTLPGWDRLEDLRRVSADSRIAFMAMPFGKSELDSIHLTVVWEASSPAAAMTKLKATIRATLPADADLSD